MSLSAKLSFLNKYFFILLTGGLFFSSPVTAQKSKNTDSKVSKYDSSKVKYGTASYYADKFNGRQTANGEIYSSEKLSAACNVLPFNTWIKVTNLRNKKSIVVRINDRLHHKNERLVDLSKVAARQLGFIAHGLAKVKIEVVPRPTKKSKKNHL